MDGELGVVRLRSDNSRPKLEEFVWGVLPGASHKHEGWRNVEAMRQCCYANRAERGVNDYLARTMRTSFRFVLMHTNQVNRDLWERLV